jgi:hypothetical protein
MIETGDKPKLHDQPKCAYCDMNPMVVASSETACSNGLILGLIWCSGCGTMLSSQVVGKAAPIDMNSLVSRIKGGNGPLII